MSEFILKKNDLLQRFLWYSMTSEYRKISRQYIGQQRHLHSRGVYFLAVMDNKNQCSHSPEEALGSSHQYSIQ